MLRHRLDWITSSESQGSESADIAQCEKAIDQLFALCGRDPPAIIWCRSFYQLATLPSLLFAIFHSDLWHVVSGELAPDCGLTDAEWLERWNELFAKIWLYAGGPILRHMYATSRAVREYGYLEGALIAQAKLALAENLRRGRLHSLQQTLKREIYRKVWYTELRQDFIKNSFEQLKLNALERLDQLATIEQLVPADGMQLAQQRGQAITEVFHALAQRLGGESALQASRVLWMSDCLSWLNAVDGLTNNNSLAVFDHLSEPLALWLAIADTASAVLSFDGITFLSEIPTACHLSEGFRLHNPSGPALTYSDGFAQYAWHGVIVPREIIEEPESISVDDIDKQANAEARRVMVERYGEARFLHDSQALPVQQDDFGTLYRKDLPNDEPLVMVRVVNTTQEPDGTHRAYFLRVPPDVATAQQAVAWTFGFDNPNEYDPAVQT